MTGTGQTEQPPPAPAGDDTPGPAPAVDRGARQTFANMLRSLVPLVVIVLAVVGWTAFRQSPDVQPVRQIDPSSTIALAANRAGYPLVVPTGLPDGYRPTSARTDAGNAEDGDPVTLEIGYVTPSDEFAGFVVSDDPRADAVTALLNDATPAGSLQIGRDTWTRSTRPHDGDQETVLSRTADGVTVVVSGSASDEELETVAGAVQPYSG
jgi:hypothetical protein